MRHRLPRWLTLLLLLVCGGLSEFSGNGLSGSSAHANETRFTPVRPGRTLQFPADHGAHPDFRIEWWYVTGWLREASALPVDTPAPAPSAASRSAPSAPPIGFQLTFFRVATGITNDPPGRFTPSQLILAHAAIADPTLGRLRHAERAERLGPLADAANDRLHVHLGDWSLSQIEPPAAAAVIASAGDAADAADSAHIPDTPDTPDTPATLPDRLQARAQGRDFSFDLDLLSAAAPWLQGHDGSGYSQKAPAPENASYYYSRPQLRVSGQLEIEGRSRSVEGHAWLDHEWSSALMPQDAVGWDWIGINLSDGGALMAFRLRNAAGEPLWASASHRSPEGAVRQFGPHAVRFTPLREWRSPRTNIAYPVSWLLELGEAEDSAAAAESSPPQRYRIEALFEDQELDSRQSTGAIYWEGAVRLLAVDEAKTVKAAKPSAGSESAPPLGEGYLELTGYGARLEM